MVEIVLPQFTGRSISIMLTTEETHLNDGCQLTCTKQIRGYEAKLMRQTSSCSHTILQESQEKSNSLQYFKFYNIQYTVINIFITNGSGNLRALNFMSGLQQAGHSSSPFQVSNVRLHRTERQGARCVATVPVGVFQGAHFDGIAQGL